MMQRTKRTHKVVTHDLVPFITNQIAILLHILLSNPKTEHSSGETGRGEAKRCEAPRGGCGRVAQGGAREGGARRGGARGGDKRADLHLRTYLQDTRSI